MPLRPGPPGRGAAPQRTLPRPPLLRRTHPWTG